MTDPGWGAALMAALVSLLGPVDATQPATRATTTCTSDPGYCNPPPTEPRAVWAHCEEWHDLAAEVGWPESRGPVLQHVMWRESRCSPSQINPVTCNRNDPRQPHAIGLLQLCGWGGSELLDARANLVRGLWLYERFGGWCPWWIPGDAVTGPHC